MVAIVVGVGGLERHKGEVERTTRERVVMLEEQRKARTEQRGKAVTQ